MRDKKTDTSFWDSRRGKIHTKKGGWIIGEDVHCGGYSMIDDLMGKKSLMQVTFLAVTGRLPERKLADWMENRFLCVSWPDHRIWPNQISSLAGTLRATSVAALTAGILACDSRLIAAGAVDATHSFITNALKKRKRNTTVEEIVESHPKRKQGKEHGITIPAIPGFNRPIASGDLRVIAFERIEREAGFGRGEHLTLAYEVSDFLYKKYGESINSAGYSAAFLCDQKISAKEHRYIYSTSGYAGMIACYSETADEPPESFFPTKCEDSDYQGKPSRPVPDR